MDWRSLSAANLRTYVGTLAAFAVALVASWIYWHGLVLDLRLVLGAAVFASLLLLGDVLSVRINEQLTISASDVALIAAVAVLGPVWAAVAALPADLFVARRDWLRLAFEISQSVVIICLAGVVF